MYVYVIVNIISVWQIKKKLKLNKKKRQKMIYLKASVRGSAEKAIAGMFFTGTMYEEAIKELTHRFGNPELISKSLINKLLELPALKDDNTSSLRTSVDTYTTL